MPTHSVHEIVSHCSTGSRCTPGSRCGLILCKNRPGRCQKCSLAGMKSQALSRNQNLESAEIEDRSPGVTDVSRLCHDEHAMPALLGMLLKGVWVRRGSRSCCCPRNNCCAIEPIDASCSRVGQWTSSAVGQSKTSTPPCDIPMPVACSFSKRV